MKCASVRGPGKLNRFSSLKTGAFTGSGDLDAGMSLNIDYLIWASILGSILTSRAGPK